MAVQFSVARRNARADSSETTIGTSPKLQLRTGAPPANCAAADTGTLLVEITLSADWAPAASGGVKTFSTPFSGTAAAVGAFGHYRLKDSAGTTTHEQGTVATSGADMTVDAASTSSIGQTVNVTSWTQTEGNA